MFDSLAIAVAHAVVVLLLWTLPGDVLARSFQDASVVACHPGHPAGRHGGRMGHRILTRSSAAANMNPLLLVSAVLAPGNGLSDS
ncbi:hypothetical protein ACU4GD_45450, partial [Cupriavidus basilensis]